MNTLWRKITNPAIISRVLGLGIKQTSTYTSIYNRLYTTSTLLKLNKYPLVITSLRSKSKKAQYDSDDEHETFDDDSTLNKDSKVVKFSTTSMRTDTILKSALGVARNKIEQVFYESKIRVNGKKIMKKSYSVRQGDEIDVIKTVSPKNPDHLYVSRIELINVSAKEDSISVTARRFKTLLIENYEEDPYKATSADSE